MREIHIKGIAGLPCSSIKGASRAFSVPDLKKVCHVKRLL